MRSPKLQHKSSLTPPPIAECQHITAPADPGLCYAVASVDASSNDPDDDLITFEQNPDGPYNLGTTDVTLTVTDEHGASSECSATITVVDQESPLPDVPALTELRGECTASVSSSPTATDACSGPITGETTNSLEYDDLGTHIVSWTFTDNSGNQSSQTQKVVVEDNTPPEIRITVIPDTLWPPNHKMVPISVEITATDNCDNNLTVTLESITMNEGDLINTFDPNYDNSIGDGNTLNDIHVDDDGNISLRAERSGAGEGRIYTITYSATDAAGNIFTTSTTVAVPHDQ